MRNLFFYLALFTIVPLLTNRTLNAQITRFKWSYEMCVCSGDYNTQHCTKQQLQNTIDYLWFAQSINAKSHAWKPSEVSQLDIEGIDKDFNAIMKKLRTKKFIETPFWQKLKETRIKALEAQYMLKKLMAMAYRNPELLKSFRVFSNACDRYIIALTEGGDKMLEEWRRLLEIKKQNNINPSRLQEEFDEKMNSPQRLEYARIDLMLFGFWNTALDVVPQVDYAWECEVEFRKLFSNVQCECDMP